MAAGPVPSAFPPSAGAQDVSPTAVLDLPWQRLGLVRYNRVEGLSVGVRAGLRFGVAGRPLSAEFVGRLGTADVQPRVEASLAHATYGARFALSAYRALRANGPEERPLGVLNSALALLAGRDDGDYHQATGVSLAVGTPTALPPRWRVRAYAERQERVVRETDVSAAERLDLDDGFRPVPAAERAEQLGLGVRLAPRWGRWRGEPRRPAAAVQVELLAERGDFAFERALVGARAALPAPAGAWLELEAAGGTTWGAPPAQRLWRLGGPATLRGLSPGVRVGASFLRGRAELARRLPEIPQLAALAVAVFADAGWAGSRDVVRWDRAVVSGGAGLSALDGVLRLDAAWAWRGASGWRVDLYLDARR